MIDRTEDGNQVIALSGLTFGPMNNNTLVWQRFVDAINKITGVSIVNSIKHDFPGGGFSGLILLSESHAAIHTWPERGMAWVELASCGDPAGLIEFRDMFDLHHAHCTHSWPDVVKASGRMTSWTDIYPMNEG